MAVGDQAQLGTGRRQPVHRRRRGGVVIAAIAADPTAGIGRVGRQEHRVVGDGAERGGGDVLGGRQRAAELAEQARQDAIADRRLIGPARAAGTRQPAPQGSQRRRLVGVAPQRGEGGVVGIERRVERFHRQREQLLRQLEPAAHRQHRVGDQRACRRRSVDQRQRLLLAERPVADGADHQRRQRHDLAGPALPLGRERRQRRAVEQPRHRGRQRARHRGMALDEVGQAAEDNAARDPVGQRHAEGGDRRQGRPRRVRPPLLAGKTTAGALAVAGGDPVDDRRRLAVEQRQERRPARLDPRQRLVRQRDTGSPPGDPCKIFEGEIGPI